MAAEIATKLAVEMAAEMLAEIAAEIATIGVAAAKRGEGGKTCWPP